MASIQQSCIAEKVRVYVIGDIHGRADLLEDMHNRISADAARAPLDRKVLIYLGDYIDRGPDSFQVIHMLSAHPLEGFKTVYLKGNHEDMMLGFLKDGDYASVWLMNGGMETLKSYQIDLANPPRCAKALLEIRQEFHEAIPRSHLDFFANLSLSHTEGDYFFAHAGVNPDKPLEAQQAADLLWIREKFLHCQASFEKTVVHGHTINPYPIIRSNRIAIDTGAYSSGRLTCLVLEGVERRFLHT